MLAALDAWAGGLAGRLAHGLDRLLDWAAGARWRGVALAALVAAIMVLPGLTAMPVTDRDEARFAQATKQMMETGDYVDIRFQDQPRWKKPAGIYWLQAGAALPLGGPEAPIAAYRLPSALAAILAAMALVWAARAVLAPRAAVLAGLMLSTTILAAAEATIAKTDATLMLTAVVALGALLRVLTDQAGRFTWVVFWLAIAAAILIKGPIVPVIALLAIAGVAVARQSLPRLGALRPLPGAVLAAALVAPWLLAIWQISGGGFFEEAVGRDLLGKVAEGQEKHWGPPGLYSLLVWATFWPAAALLPGALAAAWAERRETLIVLIAAWVLPFWIVLEVVPTKLPHYVLPLYPALAMLTAWYAERGVAPDKRWLLRLSAVIAALPGIGLGIAAFTLPLALEWALVPGALIAGLVAAALSLVAARAALLGQLRAQAAAGGLASMALVTAVLQFGLPSLDTAFPSPRLAAMAAPLVECRGGPVVSLGYREPSLVFHLGTDTRLATIPDAAALLGEDPATVLLLEDRLRPLLDDALADQGVTVDLVSHATASYFNYNRGDFETWQLWSVGGPGDGCS
ncbi:MAG: glycosyltransferase family 39 protein [Pseudomonadota bacterium]